MLIFKKGAVTGGLSCGKSSVCRYLKELGAYVVSADEIVHQLLSPKTPIGQQVIHLIGTDILIEGHIDRAKIANKVFSQPALLKSLETILHPAVRQEISKQFEFMKAHNLSNLFIAEIPLLFENGGESFFDFTICVAADPATSQKRYKEATGYDSQEFDKRSINQMDIREKIKRSTYVIHNNGTQADLKASVQTIYLDLTK